MDNAKKGYVVLILAAVVLAALMVGGGNMAWSQGLSTPGSEERIPNIMRVLAGPPEAVSGLRGRGIVYVRAGDIKAEVKEQAHYEWMQAIWVDYEIKRPDVVESGVARPGKVAFSPVRIIKEVDKATPALALACASGKRIPQVEFHFTQEAGGRTVVYLRMILRNAVVAGVGPVLIQQGAGKFVHLEEVSFGFDEIEWEYTLFDEKGKASAPVQVGWSTTKNKAL